MKAAAYSTLVRPVLKYCSTVWDPHQTTNIHNLEQVQHRAAHFVHQNYTERTPGCVTNMVQCLGRRSLQHIRYTDRLTMLFQTRPCLVDVTTDYIQPNACVSYKQLKTSASSNFTLVLSVTGIDYLPLLQMSRLSRNFGKASQVCPLSSCDPSRLAPPVHSFNRESGAFYLFYLASQFLYRVTYNLRRLLLLQWKRRGSPERSQSYQAGIQCLAIIGPPAKRHLYNPFK